MSVRSGRMKKKALVDEDRVKQNKIDSSESNNDESTCSKVTLSYDVLRIIFSYLLGRDLSNAAMVCRFWQEIAEYELKRRRIEMYLVNYNNVFRYCNREKHFSETLTNKPMLGLFFSGSDCDPPECLGRHLPRSCVSVTIVNPGVIYNDEEYDICDDLVAYTMLPEDPNVDLEFLVATSLYITRTNRKIHEHDYRRPNRISYVEPMITDTLKSLKDIKCMMIFTSENYRDSDKLYKLKVFKDNVKAMWGGVARKLFICQTNEVGKPEMQEVLWLAILISGPKVRCWSTFVEETDATGDAVKAALLRLESQIKLQRHTIGFMFTCVARGHHLYDDQYSVESKIFKSIFPHILLIGSFGNGEYGMHSDKRRQSTHDLHHQYSTTFMILTYG